MGRHPGDRELGMGRPITRRDFVNGVAAAGAGTLASAWLPGLPRDSALSTPAQDAPGYYPPALTGMRGSADGSFETAHALRDGDYWTTAPRPVDTKETYDLVVVGGGISGLAAAYFYRRRAPSARILVLDNNDDFGGHARRDEFRQSGRLLLANGGTWAIESPLAGCSRNSASIRPLSRPAATRTARIQGFPLRPSSTVRPSGPTGSSRTRRTPRAAKVRRRGGPSSGARLFRPLRAGTSCESRRRRSTTCRANPPT